MIDATKKQELLEILKDPEAQKLLANGQQADLKKQELQKPIEITEDSTPESIAAEYNKKIGGLIDYFEGRISEVKEKAVEEAQAPTKQAEQDSVNKFVADHPIITQNAQLKDLMTKIYGGTDLPIEDVYAMAMHQLNLEDEAANDDTSNDTDNENNADESKTETTSTSSLRSTSSPAEQDMGSEEEPETRDLETVIQDNYNRIMAEMKAD